MNNEQEKKERKKREEKKRGKNSLCEGCNFGLFQLFHSAMSANEMQKEHDLSSGRNRLKTKIEVESIVLKFMMMMIYSRSNFYQSIFTKKN